MEFAFPPPKFRLPDNRLLVALPTRDYLRLLPSLEQVTLRQNEILYECDGPMRYVYFPEQSLISLLTYLEDGKSVEVGVVGNPGLLGTYIALGGRSSFHEAVVEITGSALRMKADAFLAEFQRDGIFQRKILDYIRCQILMTSQSAACNRVHLLKRRLARLLLTIHDRIGSKEFPMTQEFMGRILGAPRSEVTKAAIRFRQGGLIEYQYNNIKIVDRRRLEAIVCECHWVVAEEFDRSFPRNIPARFTVMPGRAQPSWQRERASRISRTAKLTGISVASCDHSCVK
ncbi:MAG: Crp/Fnr family transcriptional regulator [Acidobacteria bacterium]|nr:Crp/Fnr family transcriptional regulator [Acidobacteriota bacterium]